MNSSKESYNITHAETNTHSLTDFLWLSVEKMRGRLDVSDSKSYFLTFFFYKYISDYWKDYVKTKSNNEKKGSLNEGSVPRFIIPENTDFDSIISNFNKADLGKEINRMFRKIEQANVPKLDGILTSLDFTNSRVIGDKNSRENFLITLIDSFANITFEPSLISNAITANCFELLYEKFAQIEGKRGEEFQTPSEVRNLLAKLLCPRYNETIYDPACGSGSLLLALHQEMNSATTGAEIYGQEINKDIYSIAKMRMLIQELDDTNIAWGDSLNNPIYLEDSNREKLKKFDIAVSNPPFSINNWWKSGKEFDRFKWGMPPQSKGDYAFIQHMLASAKEETGRVGILVTHGVLFRGGSELNIRKKIIEDNLLDAVIGLPGNLLSYTGIPVAILLFNKGRTANNSILFIDASKEFTQDKRRNILTSSGIERIVRVYNEYKKDTTKKSSAIQKGFSNVCTKDEILENDYNLNINRYIEFQEETPIDLDKLKSEVYELDKKLEGIRNTIKESLNDLGL